MGPLIRLDRFSLLRSSHNIFFFSEWSKQLCKCLARLAGGSQQSTANTNEPENLGGPEPSTWTSSSQGALGLFDVRSTESQGRTRDSWCVRKGLKKIIIRETEEAII